MATTTEDNASIRLEDSRFKFAVDESTNLADADAGNGLVDAVRGIFRVQYIGQNALDSDDPVEISYRGSESFTITVDRGPIQDISSIESPRVTAEGTNSDDPAAVNGNITVPSGNSEMVASGTHLRVLSVSDGDTCADCQVRIGVITPTRPKDKDDAVKILPGYISVLGITYEGSQRIFTGTGLRESVSHPGMAEVTTPGEEVDAVEPRISPVTFQGVLNLTPVDEGDDGFAKADIRIVGVSPDLVACDADSCPVIVHDATPNPADPNEGEKAIIFRMAGVEERTAVVGGTMTIPADGHDVVFANGATVTTANTYIDVVYTAKVGSNPRNALQPSEKVRPLIVAADGSRVSITSGNDDLAVGVEKKKPSFTSPSPIVGSATGAEDQVLSIEVTDDDLAGVDKKSVKIHARVIPSTRTGVTFDNLDSSDTYKTASGSALTFEEIDGGYRVSVPLDEIGPETSRLRVNAARTPTVLWYVEAVDNAENRGTSDAVANEGSKARKGVQVYHFTVDSEETELDRVYTGDWFNPATDRVEGDRRLGANQYLPGSSSDTSVRLIFTEPVDGGSISEDDFTVDGETPITAQWFDEGDTNPFEDPDRSPLSASVFLTVPAMAADATPTVEIVGSISDMAGNETDSGSKRATDGIAPSPTVSVDTGLSAKTVVVTVGTDERIRTLTPTLSLYVANALDAGSNQTLDEVDVFRVRCEDAADDEEKADREKCMLSLRQYEDGESPSTDPGEKIATGKDALAAETMVTVTLGKGPIMDRSRDGKVDTGDAVIADEKRVSPEVGALDDTTVDVVGDGVLGNTDDKPSRFNAEDGVVTVQFANALQWGDQFSIRYRGADPDSAKGLVSIPGGEHVVGTSWTFELNVTRSDTYAVTATAEDGAFNRGSGGIPDPTNSRATTFEIDNKLAGGGAPRTVPGDDRAGNRPVSISDPFFIDLYWDGSEGEAEDVSLPAANEAKEYEGDTSKIVTLTKAELTGPGFDGVDVLDTAVRQNAGAWRLGIQGMGVGAYTLKYNAEDALENDYDTDRSLTFTLQPVPAWELRLTAGMNLISLPSEPADGDVNGLFREVEEIDLIFTFEGGQSLVAIRNQDTGEFVGTLGVIDAQHAYWVSAENAANVPISIPPTSQLAPPPYITVKGGQWNLVPVISLGSVDSETKGSGAAPGTEIDADAYFGPFRTAFGWTGRSWDKIDPDASESPDHDDGPVVKVGMGYWVLYEENGIITP